MEGLCNGIDEELVERLGEWVTIPTTYAGGGRCKIVTNICVDSILTSLFLVAMEDLKLVDKLSHGKVDLTFGRYSPYIH